MNAQVIQQPPIRIVMLRHTGSYDDVGAVFDQLWTWVTANNVPVQKTIGIYYDNPDYVATAQLRSAACVEVPDSFQFSNNTVLPLEDTQIAGGPYVTTRFVGPYEQLAPIWSQLTRYVEHDLRRQISLNPAYEVYVNDASDTPPDQLITDLYMPIV